VLLVVECIHSHNVIDFSLRII